MNLRHLLIRLLPIAALFLVACGIIPGSKAAGGSEAGTPVPTPTKDPSGYQAIPSQACLISDWTAMQSDKAQGDLIAWQPGSSSIAYMAPSERSSWYVGTLMLAKEPDYKERVELAPGILVAGDLTWSPKGEYLAFLAFRPNEAVYTVDIVRPDGSGLTDLFPTDLARTDSRTSQKAIIGWKDDQTVQVVSSCGEECRQAYDMRVDRPPEPVLTPSPMASYRELNDALQMHRLAQTITPEAYPRGLQMPHWSPDGKQLVYLDKRRSLWLLTYQGKTIYPIDIGMRDIAETQWSSDSSRIAVRAEDRIFAFEVPCKTKKAQQ